MYAGQIVESGTVFDIFDHPGHPYTKALLESKPRGSDTAERMITIPGAPPSLYDEIEGCAFAPRCQWADDRCRSICPEKHRFDAGHYAVCHGAAELHGKGRTERC
ncbi:MAG: hypothetical protein LUE92_15570 [Clostridiales bacterium]|nr:hypothetical protein [Clostridiales bacterium]